MTGPDSRLYGRLDSATDDLGLEQQRLQAMADLGLMDTESIPVFDEATQTAAHVLDSPICILGLIDQERQWFKAAVGLSRIGLMNDLASSRQLSRTESFCAHVVETQQVLAISDAVAHPDFSDNILVRRYNIRAYLSVPLMTSNGYCVGTLAVMELKPRSFNTKEIEQLELIARWCMSEYERNHLRKQLLTAQPQPQLDPIAPSTPATIAGSVKVNLIAQMAQELRTPLTSILGMASVLTREIYGPLTQKQREYLDIIHNSGHYLLSILNEMLELGLLNDSGYELNLGPVDIEMLCQQAINTLQQAARRRELQIRLTVEPGHRIWLLDKDKVRQMLYHLVFSVIQASSTDSIIRIHVSRKQSRLSITVWTSHPWLGEGLPQADLMANQFMAESSLPKRLNSTSASNPGDHIELMGSETAHGDVKTDAFDEGQARQPALSRQSLGLMLSRQLAEVHGGQITLQGSAETGYRYVVSIPQLSDLEPEE